ncbi:MAG: hypothetical protein JRE16_10020 [Deltaproteobacteria bacterium]|jgi:hypothetical protein|nr:hypothetical protein [Deltaproteobacteria bacterium]
MNRSRVDADSKTGATRPAIIIDYAGHRHSVTGIERDALGITVLTARFDGDCPEPGIPQE